VQPASLCDASKAAAAAAAAARQDSSVSNVSSREESLL